MDFNRFDFPKEIIRVTAGNGSEALLITGSEKTALVDCGLAYCASGLIENLKAGLRGRSLDYVLASHTHYDHIGALPFVKQVWPGAITVGSEHAYNVLQVRNELRSNSHRYRVWQHSYILIPHRKYEWGRLA